jgi:hypothetical protein
VRTCKRKRAIDLSLAIVNSARYTMKTVVFEGAILWSRNGPNVTPLTEKPALLLKVCREEVRKEQDVLLLVSS